MTPDLAVEHDPAAERFVVGSGPDLAELVYRTDGRRMLLLHTAVPPHLRGRGIAGRLVRAAADHALHEGLTLVPVCSYAVTWVHAHAHELDGPPKP